MAETAPKNMTKPVRPARRQNVPYRQTAHDVREPTADITAVDQEGDLHLYSGAEFAGLYPGGVIGTGWDIFKNLI